MKEQAFISELKSNIRSGYSNFTEEEKIAIQNVEELYTELFDAVINEKVELTKTLIDFIFMNLVFTVQIDSDIFEALIKKLYFAAVSLGTYVEDLTFDDIVNFVGHDEEFINKLKELNDKKLDDKSCLFENSSLSSELINKLLDHKRYDVINNFDYGTVSGYDLYVKRHFDDDTYNRIRSEWPYEKMPKLIIDKDILEGRYVWSIDDDVEAIIDYCHKCKNEKRLELMPTLIDKLKSMSDLSFLTNNSKLYDLIIDLEFNVSEFKGYLIKKLLYDKGCISFAKAVVAHDDIDQEDINKKVEYFIENHIDIDPKILYELEIPIEEDDRLVKLILDYGHLDYFFGAIVHVSDAYKPNDKSFIRKYEDFIIKQIEEDNPYYNTYLEKCHLILEDYPNIFKAIIRKGKLKNLLLHKRFDYSGYIDDIVYAAKCNNLFINLADKNASHMPLAKALLENECYYSIIASDFDIDQVLESFEDLFLEALDNVYFADEILRKDSKVLLNRKVTEKLLKNKMFLEKTVDKINHNEDYACLYTDFNFNIIKDHYTKKYNLNLEHFRRLELQLGPQIIRYLDNESLHEIINLDEETFEKIIRLFPIVEYTSIDLEAGYESLIQYSYGKKNVEDVTIFPTFIRAVDDNNLEVLRKLKEKIILNISREVLNRIINKYNLENINSTEELLNIIISKMKTDERNNYIRIFHDVTDEFILTSRMNYHNNHYFEKKYPDFSGLFDKILNCIDSKEDEEKLVGYKNELVLRMNTKVCDQLRQKYNIPEEYSDGTSILEYVISGVKEESTRTRFLFILKEIVDNYYYSEKNKHSKELSIREELNLPHDFEEKSKSNEIIKYIILHCKEYRDEEGHIILRSLVDIFRPEGIDESLIIDCINFALGDKKITNDIELVKQNLSHVIEVATKFVREHKIYDYDSPIDEKEIVEELDKGLKIKRIYRTPESSDMYQVLINLNIDLLRECLFQNEEMFEQLIELMKKKKLHMLPDNLKELMGDACISDDYTNLAAFINFYIPIVEVEKSRLEAAGKDTSNLLNGLATILMYADTYSCVSSVYSQILGDKDAKLIKSNPGPNSAVRKIKNNQRLKEAIKWTESDYKRKEVTVPPVDTDVPVNDTVPDKKLNVIIGNFTDPSTLTLGERTGACMRIGGVGESLFEFCLSNPNGFHIRFEDPKTHEFISRVSGFRNGNTVFLNELRNSCNKDKYSDEEVVRACEEAAKLLIELTRDSEYPIDNVVITKQYAMENTKKPIISFGIDDNKEGLPKFYSDIGNSGILLASSSNNGNLVPINLDKSKVPTYKTCRSKAQVVMDTNILIAKINRVAAVKALLSGVNYEDIERMMFDEEILCGVVSDDWYIYVDKDRNVHYDYIDEDNRAKSELDQYLQIIDKIVADAVVKKSYGDDVVYGL